MKSLYYVYISNDCMYSIISLPPHSTVRLTLLSFTLICNLLLHTAHYLLSWPPPPHPPNCYSPLQSVTPRCVTNLCLLINHISDSLIRAEWRGGYIVTVLSLADFIQIQACPVFTRRTTIQGGHTTENIQLQSGWTTENIQLQGGRTTKNILLHGGQTTENRKLQGDTQQRKSSLKGGHLAENIQLQYRVAQQQNIQQQGGHTAENFQLQGVHPDEDTSYGGDHKTENI